jgi:hypothetical protein
MSSNVDRICAQIDTLDVPPFDITRIQQRASSNQRARRAARIPKTIAVALTLPALAAATIVHFFQPQIYQHGGSLNIYARNGMLYARPDSRTLSSIARALPYRVVFPQALPARAKLHVAAVADAELIDRSYACPRGRLVQFVIAPKSLGSLLHPLEDPYKHVMMHPKIGLAWHSFIAGGEIVRMANDCLTRSEVARVRVAMESAGAAKYQR